MEDKLVTDAKFLEKRIYIYVLYAGLIFFVEIAKQACVPMFSSLSLTTLSNAPPQNSLLLLPIKCSSNARGQAGMSGLEINHVRYINILTWLRGFWIKL